MKVITETWCSEEYTDGYSYGLVDLTPALAKKVFDRWTAFMALREQFSDLLSISFVDYAADFFETLPEPVEDYLGGRNELEENEVAEVPADLEQHLEDGVNGFEVKRSDGSSMNLTVSDVYWEVTAKHTDMTVQTRGIDIELVKKVAEGVS